MSDDWRNGRHVVYRLHAHIVLTPKYRKKVMTERVAAELEATFVEVCTRFELTFRTSGAPYPPPSCSSR